jgi:hypothetical protein
MKIVKLIDNPSVIEAYGIAIIGMMIFNCRLKIEDLIIRTCGLDFSS